MGLHRQSDDHQAGEQRQDPDVEGDPKGRVDLLRRAVESAEAAQPDADQVDETGHDEHQPDDHGDLGRHLSSTGHDARGPDHSQEEDDGGHPHDE